MFKALRWENWVGVVLGACLLVSPWVLEFPSLKPACISAVTVGLLTALLALWAITPFDEKISNWWQQRVARR